MAKNSKLRQHLKVISGGSQPAPPWLNLSSKLALVRSPQKEEGLSTLRFSDQLIRKTHSIGRIQPIFDAWTCVWGALPPIPNINSVTVSHPNIELIGITKAHACFRGVKRPVGEDDRGYFMAAYVTKPTWFIVNEPSMVCQAAAQRVPEDLVFVIYVVLDHPVGAWTKGLVKRSATVGTIASWEFVETDPVDKMLPVGFKERYGRRLW